VRWPKIMSTPAPYCFGSFCIVYRPILLLAGSSAINNSNFLMHQSGLCYHAHHITLSVFFLREFSVKVTSSEKKIGQRPVERLLKIGERCTSMEPEENAE
jgi:hypothetical protein